MKGSKPADGKRVDARKRGKGGGGVLGEEPGDGDFNTASTPLSLCCSARDGPTPGLLCEKPARRR